MRGISGKRIIVTGGANGIGAATARRLAEEGALVFIGDIAEEAMKARIEELRPIAQAAGGEMEGRAFDLADPPSIEALIETCRERFGGLDGLANVAVDVRSSQREVGQNLLEMDPLLWERTFRVNTTGLALTIRAAIPHMKTAGGGSIVNVSSTAGQAGARFVPAYAASKGGVQVLTKHVAMNFGKSNIRCNTVAPGWVLTESNRQSATIEAHDHALGTLPLTRLGDPSDVASIITFLLSEEAAWMTGQTIGVNGGAHFSA